MVDFEVKEVITKRYEVFGEYYDNKEIAEKVSNTLKKRAELIKKANIKVKKRKDWSVKFYFNGYLILWKSEEDCSSYYLFTYDENGHWDLRYLMEDELYGICTNLPRSVSNKEYLPYFKKMLLRYCDLEKLDEKLREAIFDIENTERLKSNLKELNKKMEILENHIKFMKEFVKIGK